jgi:predicted RNA-binding protein with PIN domain
VEAQRGPGAGEATLDRATIAAALHRVAAAASVLTDALGEVATVVAAPLPAPVDPASPPPSPHRARPAATASRHRPRLPVGVFDDSPEAAEHLVRLPGVMLLVDGYNVSLEGWPSLPLLDQRRRLVDALGTLAARTGCTPLVVFDGAEAGSGLPGESRARGVQVRFTEPGVEADDALLALVDDVPVDRAVVVASSDRRVADGARKKAAASVSSEQLLVLLRR